MTVKPGQFPLPKSALLSVVIPAYNAEQWIVPTLNYFQKSLAASPWNRVEIIVVDDGSTDETANRAESADLALDIRVLRQPNRGRLEARRNGIAAAKGDYVLLLDSRVFAEPEALTYLAEQIVADRSALVWNGHVILERKGNLYARFWYAITVIAWRRYLAHPRHISFGAKEFDYYPKGAGCFFAPREYLLDAYSQFSSSYSDDKYANDDTSLLRLIADRSPIHISPGFAFTYNSRSTLKAFTRHTLHRGIVFLDGYFHRGSRYYYMIWGYFIAVPLLLVLVIWHPQLLLLIPFAMLAVSLLALILGNKPADAAALGWVMPVFALYYSIGIWRGAVMRWTSQSKKRT